MLKEMKVFHKEVSARKTGNLTKIDSISVIGECRGCGAKQTIASHDNFARSYFISQTIPCECWEDDLKAKLEKAGEAGEVLFEDDDEQYCQKCNVRFQDGDLCIDTRDYLDILGTGYADDAYGTYCPDCVPGEVLGVIIQEENVNGLTRGVLKLIVETGLAGEIFKIAKVGGNTGDTEDAKSINLIKEMRAAM